MRFPAAESAAVGLDGREASASRLSSRRHAKGVDVATLESFTETTKQDGAVLLNWLRLLGWRVDIDRDGDEWIGRARHIAPTGEELFVGGCAESQRELVSELFCRALSARAAIKKAA
jgi:hypothetical protein